MEISIDIFLSIEDIDDILLLFSKTSVENFINTLHLFPKCRWITNFGGTVSATLMLIFFHINFISDVLILVVSKFGK